MKKLLIFLAISQFAINNSNAQWYSYDGFKKEGINVSQTFFLANKKFQKIDSNLINAPVSLNVHSVSKYLKNSTAAYKKSFEQNRKDSITKIVELNTSIAVQEKLLTTETDEERKKEINDQIKKLVEERDERTNTPELNERIKDKFAELRYLRKRLPGIRLFPVTSRLAAESYFENHDTLVHESDADGVFSFEYAYLNYLTNSKRLGFFVEPISDNIGPVRLSLGLLLLAPANKDTTGGKTPVEKQAKDSINSTMSFRDRFKSSGGNASINASFPLLQAHDANNYFDFKSYLSPRFCIDVPREDTAVQRFAFNTQLGFESQLKIKTYKDVFNILLCHRYARILGNSTFYDNMGFKNKDRKSFNFTTWTVGFIAKNRLAVYYTWYAGKSLVTETIKNNNSLTANIQL